VSGVRAEIMVRFIAGYPRSGNFTPKALLRAFEPVAAEIRKREGFTGILSFQSISIFILFKQLKGLRSPPLEGEG
jgi:hypothetical protein